MLPLHESIVYGPVRSRRLGYSLGINILPRNAKVCTFNCSYCQYGWTRNAPRGSLSATGMWPTPTSIARALSGVLQRVKTSGERIDRLTLAGHGEPTLHPQFEEVVAGLRTVRDKFAPGTPLAILSNSTTLDKPSVRRALLEIDERYMKLDAGDPTLVRRINGSTIQLEQLVKGLRELDDIVIQSMFVRDRLSRIDNATDIAVAIWITLLQTIRPKAVQIYTIDRAPAWPYLQPVASPRLEEIARRARTAGLEADSFLSATATAAPGVGHHG